MKVYIIQMRYRADDEMFWNGRCWSSDLKDALHFVDRQSADEYLRSEGLRQGTISELDLTRFDP